MTSGAQAEARAALRATVGRLVALYDDARADLATRHVDPELVVTMDGRYILLDALTAIVQAQAVLASA